MSSPSSPHRIAIAISIIIIIIAIASLATQLPDPRFDVCNVTWQAASRSSLAPPETGIRHWCLSLLAPAHAQYEARKYQEPTLGIRWIVLASHHGFRFEAAARRRRRERERPRARIRSHAAIARLRTLVRGSKPRAATKVCPAASRARAVGGVVARRPLVFVAFCSIGLVLALLAAAFARLLCQGIEPNPGWLVIFGSKVIFESFAYYAICAVKMQLFIAALSLAATIAIDVSNTTLGNSGREWASSAINSAANVTQLQLNGSWPFPIGSMTNFTFFGNSTYSVGNSSNTTGNFTINDTGWTVFPAGPPIWFEPLFWLGSVIGAALNYVIARGPPAGFLAYFNPLYTISRLVSTIAGAIHLALVAWIFDSICDFLYSSAFLTNVGTFILVVVVIRAYIWRVGMLNTLWFGKNPAPQELMVFTSFFYWPTHIFGRFFEVCEPIITEWLQNNGWQLLKGLYTILFGNMIEFVVNTIASVFTLVLAMISAFLTKPTSASRMTAAMMPDAAKTVAAAAATALAKQQAERFEKYARRGEAIISAEPELTASVVAKACQRACRFFLMLTGSGKVKSSWWSGPAQWHPTSFFFDDVEQKGLSSYSWQVETAGMASFSETHRITARLVNSAGVACQDCVIFTPQILSALQLDDATPPMCNTGPVADLVRARETVLRRQRGQPLPAAPAAPQLSAETLRSLPSAAAAAAPSARAASESSNESGCNRVNRFITDKLQAAKALVSAIASAPAAAAATPAAAAPAVAVAQAPAPRQGRSGDARRRAQANRYRTNSPAKAATAGAAGGKTEKESVTGLPAYGRNHCASATLVTAVAHALSCAPWLTVTGADDFIYKLRVDEKFVRAGAADELMILLTGERGKTQCAFELWGKMRSWKAGTVYEGEAGERVVRLDEVINITAPRREVAQPLGHVQVAAMHLKSAVALNTPSDANHWTCYTVHQGRKWTKHDRTSEVSVQPSNGKLSSICRVHLMSAPANVRVAQTQTDFSEPQTASTACQCNSTPPPQSAPKPPQTTSTACQSDPPSSSSPSPSSLSPSPGQPQLVAASATSSASTDAYFVVAKALNLVLREYKPIFTMSEEAEKLSNTEFVERRGADYVRELTAGRCGADSSAADIMSDILINVYVDLTHIMRFRRIMSCTTSRDSPTRPPELREVAAVVRVPAEARSGRPCLALLVRGGGNDEHFSEIHVDRGANVPAGALRPLTFTTTGIQCSENVVFWVSVAKSLQDVTFTEDTDFVEHGGGGDCEGWDDEEEEEEEEETENEAARVGGREAIEVVPCWAISVATLMREWARRAQGVAEMSGLMAELRDNECNLSDYARIIRSRIFYQDEEDGMRIMQATMDKYSAGYDTYAAERHSKGDDYATVSHFAGFEPRATAPAGALIFGALEYMLLDGVRPHIRAWIHGADGRWLCADGTSAATELPKDCYVMFERRTRAGGARQTAASVSAAAAVGPSAICCQCSRPRRDHAAPSGKAAAEVLCTTCPKSAFGKCGQSRSGLAWVCYACARALPGAADTRRANLAAHRRNEAVTKIAAAESDARDAAAAAEPAERAATLKTFRLQIAILRQPPPPPPPVVQPPPSSSTARGAAPTRRGAALEPPRGARQSTVSVSVSAAAAVGPSAICCQCSRPRRDHAAPSGKSAAEVLCTTCPKSAFGKCGQSRSGLAWVCYACARALPGAADTRRANLAAHRRNEAVTKIAAAESDARDAAAAAEPAERAATLKMFRQQIAILRQPPPVVQPPPSPSTARGFAATRAVAALKPPAEGLQPPAAGMFKVPMKNFVTAPAFSSSSRIEETSAAAQFVYTPSHFRCSQGQVPSLAAIPTGQLLVEATLYDRDHLSQTSSLVDSALTDSVRQQHRKLLSQFRDWLLSRPVMILRPLEETAAYFIQELGHARKWQWQTLHRSMCSLVGAFSNAPLYSNLPHSVYLNTVAPHYRAALNAVNQLSQQSQPHGQTAVCLEHMVVAVEEEPRLWARVALLLMWLSSARVGCILQLRVEDVRLDEEGQLSVHFAHGKGVRLRGPYTVGSRVTGEWWRLVAQYLQARQRAAAGKEDQLLFPATEETILSRRMARMLASIRVAHPALNLRAMRRGSLQTLVSAENVPIAAAMERAGHTSVRTTRGYLDWGLKDREALLMGARLTAPLLPV